jgi:hypothetical protein
VVSESVVDVNVQSVPVTTADPSNVTPSNTSTVVPDSVVPVIVGVLSFVVPDAVVITGAAGVAVSTVKVRMLEDTDVLFAASVAFAVML